MDSADRVMTRDVHTITRALPTATILLMATRTLTSVPIVRASSKAIIRATASTTAMVIVVMDGATRAIVPEAF